MPKSAVELSYDHEEISTRKEVHMLKMARAPRLRNPLYWINPRLPIPRFLLQEANKPFFLLSYHRWIFYYSWPNTLVTDKISLKRFIR